MLETEPELLRDAARRRVFAAGVNSMGSIPLRSIRKENERLEIAYKCNSSKKNACHSHQCCDSDYDEERAGYRAY